MDKTHILTGKKGEEFCVNFLKKNKFKVLETNFRTNFGEIDIIGISKDKILVFFEVKTMSEGSISRIGMSPEDQMTKGKILRFKRAAQFYANQHPELVKDGGYRLDTLAVIISKDNEFLVTHYENIA